MERHRCTKCRNPIRNLAIARPGATENAWYHADCWAEVCSSEQKKYEERVKDAGLTALLAPYFHTARAATARLAPTPAVEQPQA